MSFTTKLFVVLLAIFSIANAAVEIAFITTTYNYKELYERGRGEVDAAKANMANAENNAFIVKAKLTASLARLEQAKAGVEAKLAAAQGNAQAKDAEIASLRAKVTGLDATVATLAQGQNNSDTERVMLGKMLADEQKKSGSQSRIIIDQTARINEQSHKIKTLGQKARFVERRNEDLRNENTDLRGKLAALEQGTAPAAAVADAGAVRGVTPAVVPQIKATVTKVQEELAEISVGSADGVRKGMVFDVYRGTQYLAQLEIQAVDAEAAAGTVTLYGDVPVQSGDQVAKGL